MPDPQPQWRHPLELSEEEFDALWHAYSERYDRLVAEYPDYAEGEMLARWDLEELDDARNPSIEQAQQLYVDEVISLDALERALERAYRRDPLLVAAIDDCMAGQLAQRGITQPTPA
jgi:hypothetical protein